MSKKILLFGLLLVIPFVLALKGEIEGDFYADNIIADDPDAQIKFYGGTGMKWAVGTSGGASDNFIIYDHGSSSTRLTINDSNGDVGIGTSNPTMKLDVNGNVTANDFITKSLAYNGDALSILRVIRKENVNEAGFGRIDHASAEELAVIFDYKVDILNEKGEKTGEETKTFEGISTDRTMAALIRANQQLLERVEQLESEVTALKSR